MQRFARWVDQHKSVLTVAAICFLFAALGLSALFGITIGVEAGVKPSESTAMVDAQDQTSDPPQESEPGPQSEAPPPSQPPADSAQKVCYLTFDDGPSDLTPQILDILARYDAKATFFVVGTKKLEYLPAIRDGGHTIGLHANEHAYSKIYASDAAFYADLQTLHARIAEATGVQARYIRFPGGSSNTVSKKYNKGIMGRLVAGVTERGYLYADWNIDSGDALKDGVAPETLLQNIQRSVGNKKDICILMHDAKVKYTTVQALPAIIEFLREQGFVLRALDDAAPAFHHHINN